MGKVRSKSTRSLPQVPAYTSLNKGFKITLKWKTQMRQIHTIDLCEQGIYFIDPFCVFKGHVLTCKWLAGLAPCLWSKCWGIH